MCRDSGGRRVQRQSRRGTRQRRCWISCRSTAPHPREQQRAETGSRPCPPRADAEAVLLDLTGDAESKRVGLNIEAGYAKALDKTVFALWRVPERPHMTIDLADFEDSYKHDGEIEEVIHRRFAE
ncbi:hypothetical protein [Actinomadura sp. NBRC 104412]|uniref:hypothetical protein n=1 Tax=Actinomadura sp. NBRC 104412 TaxID=3032203 RepID=UPI002553121C|nr:hypothetical protein [Actinomadura sp. NBRC 104412]